MSTNVVEVLNWYLSQPVSASEWSAVSAGAVLTGTALLVGSLYRLARRAFAGWEVD